MLQKQERVADFGAAAFLDEARLQFERRAVLDEPEPAHVERPRDRRRAGLAGTGRYTHDSSKFCSRSFRASRNRPASAPSIKR